MRIAVCLKQVPEEANFDRTTNTVVREKRKQIANPSDMYALELALEIRDRTGGEVVALSMGKPFAESMLSAAIALGADRACLISDPALGGSDTYATASVLASAVQTLDVFDLVICGRRAIDGETGQVGPELAVLLGMPCLTNICGLVEVDDQYLVCRRLLEERIETYRVRLPVLLTCCDGVEGMKHPRLTSIAGMRRAKQTPVRMVTLADLPGVRAYGLTGSPTRVFETYFPEETVRECRFVEGGETGVDELARILRQMTTEPSP